MQTPKQQIIQEAEELVNEFCVHIEQSDLYFPAYLLRRNESQKVQYDKEVFLTAKQCAIKHIELNQKSINNHEQKADYLHLEQLKEAIKKLK